MSVQKLPLPDRNSKDIATLPPGEASGHYLGLVWLRDILAGTELIAAFRDAGGQSVGYTARQLETESQRRFLMISETLPYIGAFKRAVRGFCGTRLPIGDVELLAAQRHLRETRDKIPFGAVAPESIPMADRDAGVLYNVPWSAPHRERIVRAFFGRPALIEGGRGGARPT